MSGIKTFFDQLGIRPSAGADPAVVAHVEDEFEVRLPEPFRELYRFSDGLQIPGGRMEFRPLSRLVKEWAGTLAVECGYVPLAFCSPSGVYVICCNEPLRGFIMDVRSGEGLFLVCRDLGRFLELVAQTHL